MRIGYRRVSTLDQNTARQLEGIPLDKVFEDHADNKDLCAASGQFADEPEEQRTDLHSWMNFAATPRGSARHREEPHVPRSRSGIR